MVAGEYREARGLLNWSHDDMAGASDVPAEIIAMFEGGALVGMMDLQVRMRHALEVAGIGFPFLLVDAQFVPLSVTQAATALQFRVTV